MHKVVKKPTRSEQSRLNGAQSKGPTSVAGKAASSKNAIKHGFAASVNVVLSLEDEEDFNQHVARFSASFRPQDYVEQNLVDELAAINWRKSRLVALETNLIDAQVSQQDAAVRRMHPYEADNPYFHLVLAWQSLAHQPPKPDPDRDPNNPPDTQDVTSIELVRRYLVTLDRQYRNGLHNLRQYRKEFAPAAPTPPEIAPTPNETDTPADSGGSLSLREADSPMSTKASASHFASVHRLFWNLRRSTAARDRRTR